MFMITRKYLGGLISITIVLVILVITSTQVMADSPTDSNGKSQENAAQEKADADAKSAKGQIGHHSYTSESGEIKKCEGMIYKTAEAAKEAAIKNGCSTYHKLDKDGTVWYMPDC